MSFQQKQMLLYLEICSTHKLGGLKVEIILAAFYATMAVTWKM
jgi:hypothetical protein